jgi:GNAT superfamily N-acetyltransferase
MISNSPTKVVEIDLDRADHQRDVLSLTAAYALDPMGNGGPLSPGVLDRLITGLRSHPTTLIFVAYVEGKAAALATCFRGFSTFFALPLINIHDLVVLPEHRGRGLADCSSPPWNRRLVTPAAARSLSRSRTTT